MAPEAKEWLLDEAGIDPSVGARPLRRTIQRHVQDSVSELLIGHEGPPITRIDVLRSADGLRLEIDADAAEPAMADATPGPAGDPA